MSDRPAIRIVLLPKGDYTQDSDIFALDSDVIRRNLAPDNQFASDGIPSPWTRELLMRWRLLNRGSEEGKRAVGELRALVLLQFLRRTRRQTLELYPGDEGLGRLFRVLLTTGESQSLVTWRADRLPGVDDGVIVAASTAECLFFPAAGVELEKLQKALDEAFGPRSKRPLLDALGAVAEPDLAATLARYLDALISFKPGCAWANALGTWKDELANKGGRVQPTATLHTTPGVSPGSLLVPFETWVDRAPWNCPDCASAKQVWMNQDGRLATITRQQPNLLCPKDKKPIRKENGEGEPVTYADLGCHPAGELYVWDEEEAWPNDRTVAASKSEWRSDGSGYLEHYFNRLTLRVEGKLVKVDDVLLPPAEVAWVARCDGEDPFPADAPVHGEYAALIQSCEADKTQQRWRLHLKGYPDEIVRDFPLAQRSDLWNRSAILVWPPRQAPATRAVRSDTPSAQTSEQVPAWRIDYIAAGAPGAVRFKVITRTEGNSFAVSPPRPVYVLYQIQSQTIEYIELGDWSGGRWRPMGLMKVDRSTLEPPAATSAEVVLDFGTTNSAVLWQFKGRAPGFFQSGIVESALAENAFLGTFAREELPQLERTGSILLAWHEEGPEHVRPFVPSLLAEPLPINVDAAPWIPPRETGLLLMQQRTVQRVFTGLKWKDWGDTQTRERVLRLVEALLLPALWALRAEGVQEWSLRATFPLAFQAARADRSGEYQKIIDEAVARLCGPNGFTGLPVTPVRLYSESAAGAALLPRGMTTFEVSLDLGGGTLDIAVLVGAAGKTLWEKVPGEPVAADSLEYGGRHFLGAIVTAYASVLPRFVKQWSETSGVDVPETVEPGNREFWIEQLEVVLHREGTEGLTKLLKSRETDFAQTELEWRWEALMAGIELYIRRILEGAILNAPGRYRSLSDVAVSFNLLGQGWDLLRLYRGQANPSALIQQRLDKVCGLVARSTETTVQQSIVQQLPASRRKTAVVEGALKLGAATNPQTGFLGANRRNTFAGMAMFEAGGAELFGPSTPLDQLKPERRPTTPGDPGYGRLINELWEQVGSESRPAVQRLLLESPVLRRASVHSVEQQLILLGQDTLNRRWPAERPAETSPLADFLTEVWKEIWSAKPVR